MKKLFITVLFLITSAAVVAQTPIQTVDFETDGAGYTVQPQEYTVPDPANSALPDYWTRTNGGAEIDPSVPFSNFEGSWFFAGEDLDNLASVYSVTCDQISISGYSNLQVKLLVGARGDGSTKEGEEYLRIQYQIDGGGFITLAQFLGNGTYYTEDADADDVVDGADLIESMQEFTYYIPGTGSTLQIKVVANNGGSEEIAFDNIRVNVTTPDPPTVTTTEARAISTNSATIGGDVTSDGGASVLERGIVYSTTDATPTIAEGATKDSNGFNTGSFSEIIRSFSANTTYYYNAYAINSQGTAYGTPGSFTTAQTLIQVVDFETDGDGYTVTTGLTVDLDGDYWTRTDGTSNGVSFTYPFTGMQETYFFAGEDVDGYLPAYVITDAADVTGFTNLQVNLLLGAKDNTGTKEVDDFLKIEYSIDGGAFTVAGQFLGDPDELPESLDYFQEDTDLDGVFDEDGIPLTFSMQEFTYDIPATGNSLQLRISVSNGAGEEVAFDNIQLMGTSTIPGIPVNVAVSSDGSEVTVSWDAVTGATSYNVYSSEDPYSGFTLDTSGYFNGTSWTASYSGNKLFYYVVAVN